jgi:hypothetical protein
MYESCQSWWLVVAVDWKGHARTASDSGCAFVLRVLEGRTDV